MDLLAVLQRSGGIESLARHLGAHPATVLEASRALIPSLLSVMRTFVATRGGGAAGLQALVDLIDSHGDGTLAVEVMRDGPVRTTDGEELLALLLPAEEERARLSGEAATALGHELASQAALLPLLVMLVCGYIAARAATDGGVGGLGEIGEALTRPA